MSETKSSKSKSSESKSSKSSEPKHRRSPESKLPLSDVLGLIGWLAVVAATASAGALFTSPDWYQELNRPSFSPPGWLFGPVWTVLYAMMAVAAWRVWRREGFAGARLGLGLFLAHLIPNAAWSWLFFGLQMPALALADIFLLFGLIVAIIIAFWKHSKIAAGLMVPYAAWVAFATVLNAAIVVLN